MFTRSVSFSELEIAWENIWQESGCEGYVPDAATRQLFDEVAGEIARTCRPSYGYVSYPNEGSDKTTLHLGGRSLRAGGIISRYLYEADEFVLFVATAGRDFEALQRRFHEEGDIVKQYFADIIGSEIAEALGRLLSRELEAAQAARGFRISNSYSPGYCGWPVSEQQILFSLLPPAPCGITRTDSSMMLPIKSISGVIAVGTRIEKKPYGCAICGKKDCYKNRLRKKQEKQ